jgi:predicted outer membrane protein
MKKVIALLVVAGLASFAVASDKNTTAPKADKNASKAHKAEKKEVNASK